MCSKLTVKMLSISDSNASMISDIIFSVLFLFVFALPSSIHPASFQSLTVKKLIFVRNLMVLALSWDIETSLANARQVFIVVSFPSSSVCSSILSFSELLVSILPWDSALFFFPTVLFKAKGDDALLLFVFRTLLGLFAPLSVSVSNSGSSPSIPVTSCVNHDSGINTSLLSTLVPSRDFPCALYVFSFALSITPRSFSFGFASLLSMWFGLVFYPFSSPWSFSFQGVLSPLIPNS